MSVETCEICDLPTELRMLVLGSDPADVISTPDPPVPPSRPMLPGDY